MQNKTIKTALFGKTLAELQNIVDDIAMPKYTAKQIASWLYQKDIFSFSEMTNISKQNLEKIKKNFIIGKTKANKVQLSADGTKKYLFPINDDRFIETAFIPEKKRNTLCISSQVGCKMACEFCMTGKQGFQSNLSSTDILNQLKSIPESHDVNNIVFMGMGEPLDNIDNLLKSLEILTSAYGFGMSPKRITVSTVGILKPMNRFLSESKCHLAISLHNPFHDERLKIMPVEKSQALVKVLKILKDWSFDRNRRVSFEYIMFKDFNDSMRHVNELARLLNGLNCRINLIRFHPVPGLGFESSGDERIFEFQTKLKAKGIITTLRASRGLDIDAACGLLSTKELLAEQKFIFDKKIK